MFMLEMNTCVFPLLALYVSNCVCRFWLCVFVIVISNAESWKEEFLFLIYGSDILWLDLDYLQGYRRSVDWKGLSAVTRFYVGLKS